MENNGSSYSNNTNQQGNSPVNPPTSQTQEKKTLNWNALVLVFVGIFLVLSLFAIAYITVISPYRIPTQSPTTSPNSAQTPTYEPTTPAKAVELPPLYSGFKWKYTEKKVKGSSYTRKGDTIELDMYRADSEILTSYPTEFVTYYKQELAAKGWVETAMAGSGISGDFYFYEKDGRYINFGVFSTRDSSGKILGEYWAFVEHT